MRFLICMMLSLLFAPVTHADVWFEYIQVQCDPKKKIFAVRDITVGETYENGRSVPATKSIKTPGEIYGKRDGIEWKESENANVITVTNSVLDIPSCIIEDLHEVTKFEYQDKAYPGGIKVRDTTPVEFKVVRTSIDQGNVQRQCGAALGAAFTVYLNDEPLGYYPSEKELCFRSFLNSNTVSYSPRGIQHCERPNTMSTNLPGLVNMKTNITVCREGSATEYLKFLKFMKSNPEKQEEANSIPKLENQELRNKYRAQSHLVSRANRDLMGERVKTETLTKWADKVEKQRNDMKAERDALKIEIDTLQQELKSTRGKSFWERVFNK